MLPALPRSMPNSIFAGVRLGRRLDSPARRRRWTGGGDRVRSRLARFRRRWGSVAFRRCRGRWPCRRRFAEAPASAAASGPVSVAGALGAGGGLLAAWTAASCSLCCLMEPVMSSRLRSSMAMRRGEPLAVGGEFAHLGREALVVLGHRARPRAAASAATARTGSLAWAKASCSRLPPASVWLVMATAASAMAAAPPQPNSRQSGRARSGLRTMGKSGSGGVGFDRHGKPLSGRITSLKTLAESGNARFHCVARRAKQRMRCRRRWRSTAPKSGNSVSRKRMRRRTCLAIVLAAGEGTRMRSACRRRCTGSAAARCSRMCSARR